VTDDFILTHNTFIACAVALKYLEQRLIKKIVVTRPAITAEEFGFLPGNIDEKMYPFLYPIFSIFEELIGKDKRDEYIQKGYIEILPVAFSRGVTLGGTSGVITIVDEAENMNIKQSYLMLTRLGNNPYSKIIFAGDELQTDLKKGGNALSTLRKILEGSPYVGFTEFNSKDIVRSAIVQDIVNRFEMYSENNVKENGGQNDNDKRYKKDKTNSNPDRSSE
jgi:phosphate starvation-inducible PhoH-like protein